MDPGSTTTENSGEDRGGGSKKFRVSEVPLTSMTRTFTYSSERSWIGKQGKDFYYNPRVGLEVVQKYNSEMTMDDQPDIDEGFAVDDSGMNYVRGVIVNLKDTHFVIARLPLDGTLAYKQTVGIEEYLMRMITGPEFSEKL
jgi:hypothetical protein